MAKKAAEQAKGNGTRSGGEKIEKVFISEADQYLFSQATHYDIYKKLGAHVSEERKKKGSISASGHPMPAGCMSSAASTAGRRMPMR